MECKGIEIWQSGTSGEDARKNVVNGRKVARKSVLIDGKDARKNVDLQSKILIDNGKRDTEGIRQMERETWA